MIPATVGVLARTRGIMAGVVGPGLIVAAALSPSAVAYVGLACVGVSLCALGAIAGGRRRLFVVVLNLGVGGVLAWAMAERDTLILEHSGQTLGVRLGGVHLSATAPIPTRVRAWFDDAPLRSDSAVDTSIEWLAFRARNSPESGILLSAGATHLSSALSARSVMSQEVTRERAQVPPRLPSIELIRPDGRLTVVVDDGGLGVAAIVEPRHRTMRLHRWDGDGIGEQVAGGLFQYKRSSAAWLQAIVRDLSGTWLAAWALIGLASVVPNAPTWRALGMSRSVIAPAAVFGATTMVATGYVAGVVLERIPHVQDDVTYLFQAEVFARGRPWVASPRFRDSFEQEFVVSHEGKWFGKYPPGHPLALSIGAVLGQAWLVGPFMAAATVVMGVALAGRLHGAMTAWLTGAFLFASPFVMLMSGTMMAHVSGLFWTALLALLAARGGGWRTYLGAGFAFGMLFVTRHLTAVAVGMALLVPLGLAAIRNLGSLPVRLTFGVIGLVPPIAFLAFFNQALTGDVFTSPYELWWEFDRVGFGPTTGMHGGHDLANGLSNTFANLAMLREHLYGWPGPLTLALAIVPMVSLAARRWDWVLAASALGLMAGYVFYWADGIMYGPRYFYEATLALVVLTTRGLACLAGAAWSTPRGIVVMAIAGALWLWTLVLAVPEMVLTASGYNGISRASIRLVDAQVQPPALVFVRQDPPAWQPYGSVFTLNTPLLDGPIVAARDLGRARNADVAAAFPNRRIYRLDGESLREYVP
jgi:hypothetical protein